ncbi:uncharacterized protein [Dysidea avara]|uniref:uncharacterized protein n=1 Tax=Dysidea avara TaxID=196820 RepID=UPI003317F117
MKLNTVCQHVVILLSSVLIVNSMTVYPGQNYIEGNCSGSVDYFLCNCLTSNTTIDIHLSPGHYHFRTQSNCSLDNKTNITIIGSTSDDTIIECNEPFNIVFLRSQNIIISNVRLMKCGDVVNDFISQTVQSVVRLAYFGNGFRFAIMFYEVKNVTITNFEMSQSLGYGILAFNALGEVMLSNVQIKDTNFNNDPSCKNYSYPSDEADFSCSGSGILLYYYDHVDIDGVDEADANLTIDQSKFEGNINFLPVKDVNILYNVVKTGYYRVPIPIQGAGSIGIYYLQNFYDVNTEITNTTFRSNHGFIGGSATIISFSSTRSITRFKGCSLSSEDTESVAYNINPLYVRDGISYFYLLLRNAPGIHYSSITTIASFNALHVLHCSFNKLRGTIGAAFHIVKSASTSVSLVVRIEECNFTKNAANAGSAVYVSNSRIGDSSSLGGVTVHLVNVNAKKNTISSGSTLEYDTSDFITGVFHTQNSHFIVNCTHYCNFIGNWPSVFYGRSGFISVLGKALFIHNSGHYGGAFYLTDTVMYIYKYSQLLFAHNYATRYGGAIAVHFYATNTQSQDVCPIQFIGPSDIAPIFSLDDLYLLNVNITFDNNTVGNSSSLQSIYANVFYVCYWYLDTLTQYNFDLNVPPVDGTRDTVYRRVFNFIPNGSIDDHLNIVASLPCPCDSSGDYNATYCMTAGYNKTLKLSTPIIIGRPFQLSLVGLDEVGSVGATTTLYGDVYTTNATDGTLTLANGQNIQTFLTTNKTCSPIDFTVHGMQSTQPTNGKLKLSFSRWMQYEFCVNFSNCPVGFSYQKDSSGLYSCVCGKFLKFNVHDDFHCDSPTGIITRINLRSWLSVSGDKIEYTKWCLLTYCNRNDSSFMLSDTDHLCKNNHTGRACGSCIESYSRVFGSFSCKQCSNTWLATIVLYGLLGVILVFILFVLRLTVTMGAINGLIFFCNAMSINENLFFNENQFSFLRVFISFINLDLGFYMCFYDGMTQIAKTGLQFVFPIYLWLLIMIIIFTENFHFRRRISSYSAVPVFATLILLSYSKLLRTTISVFSFVTIHYTSNESNYSVSQSVVTWLPDSSVKYLQGWHCVLFVISLAVTLLFVLPFTFSSTFPKIVLRSKRLSYFFPFLDCFFAPYKDKYRSWLGIRLVELIYLSGIEIVSVLFSDQETSLLLSVVVVSAFAIVQVYIFPFKSTLINILDLVFTGIFILLSVIIVYLSPSTSGYKNVNIAVDILGSIAFFFTCLVIIFHIHNVVKHTKWYNRVVPALEMKFNLKKRWNRFSQNTVHQENNLAFMKRKKGTPYFIQFQESLLAEM